MLLVIELFTTLVFNMIYSLSCEPCGFKVKETIDAAQQETL